ncbi:STOREKEEPER protein-like [Argentina anserina]|uniref:STOREKEEPER protein-like n=1 Tax=Argentina anserina TaxID=57926 RepID=UPI0021763000|nr:STOREKEEPER protein-like [Potentilla anserina]
MAPHKHLPEDPPAASSMDEDSDAETIAEEEEEEEEVENDVVEDEKEEEEDEEDDNEEQENVNAKKPQSESASDDDADSETESDNMSHSPSASDFTVKPIISKPMTDSPAKKPTKKTAAAPAKPSSGSKRAAETDSNPKDSKKTKKGGGANGGGGGDDEDSKKGQGRLWGEEDEIAILQGMIDFKAKKDTDPSANMGAFHEYLKNNLKADVSKNQLTDKARRLKKKYQTNADKGEEAVFAKAHELKSFELSKRIWGVEADGADDGGKSGKKKPRKSVKAGNNNNNSSTVLALPVVDSGEKSARNNVEKKAGVSVANGGVKAEPEEFWSKYPYLSDSLRVGSCPSKWEGMERVVSQGVPSIGSSKAKGLDERWRKLQVLEMELAVNKLDLMHQQAKLALEAMKMKRKE